MTTYRETLEYMYAQLPMYQKVGATAIKKNLKNITDLLELLGNSHRSQRYIHVAGTNGKGSTAHLIAAVLQISGLKVGLYTSPHYVDFRERIKINGDFIPENAVIEFVEKIRTEIGTIKPSFFEITVAMALDYFTSKNVDIAIIETGLGGRLDSTNIIDPLFSVITNISLDHQNVLGHDEYAIAKEKAGIIKKNKPVVVGRYQSSCDQVFLKGAAEKNAAISFASLDWCHLKNATNTQFIHKPTKEEITVEIPDSSPFILENIITTLEAIRVYNILNMTRIEKMDIPRGIADFRALSNYRGRWQQLGKDPLIVADSAHNYEALKSVFEHLENLSKGQIHFVLGFVKDKDLESVIPMLDNESAYYFTTPAIDRGLPVDILMETARKFNIHGNGYNSVGAAIIAAINEAKSCDIIFIGGSSFVVADALKHFKSVE